MKYTILFLLILCSFSSCFYPHYVGQKKGNRIPILNPKLDFIKWREDSLGCLGYRERIILKDSVRLSLEEGINVDSLKKYFGKPIGESKHSLIYQISSSKCKNKYKTDSRLVFTIRQYKYIGSNLEL